jgi:translation initiation factor IF-3
MTEMIHKLKGDIKKCMLRKFGREIDLDELEESVLQKLVAKLPYSTNDIKKAYERRILEMQVVMNCTAYLILTTAL